MKSFQRVIHTKESRAFWAHVSSAGAAPPGFDTLVGQVTPVTDQLRLNGRGVGMLMVYLRRLNGLDIDYEDTVPLVEALVARVLGLDRQEALEPAMCCGAMGGR